VKDLTPEEEANVRAAILFLRSRTGQMAPVAKAVGFSKRTLANIIYEGRTVTASSAFRTAKVLGVLIDDLLVGRYRPPEPVTVADIPRRLDTPGR
jgi:hypothetical protein